MSILQLKNGEVVSKWKSVSEVAKELGLSSSHIYKCLKGRRSTHGGFSWKYSNEKVSEFLESRTTEFSGDTGILTAKTEKSIQSLEEAIDFFEIDIDVWDIERYVVNSWDVTLSSGKKTNYQVKVWLKKKDNSLEEAVAVITDLLKGYTPKKINYNKGVGTITGEFADFHIGADIRNLVRTRDFNIDILCDYMSSAAKQINDYKAEKVVLNLHGDFVETITGLNHEDSWKSIGKDMYGANVLIMANEIMAEHFISKINNVTDLNLVSGNHDRISDRKSLDNYGEGAKILAYMLKKDFPKLNIDFNHLIMVKEIDGINHIISHGDHGISKKDLSKVVADYGRRDLFNLWTEGHLHSRKSKKVLKTKLAIYDNVDYIELDEQNYRKLTLPPMFTGNFFSESIGHGSTCGFVVTYNNGKGLPNIHDYSL